VCWDSTRPLTSSTGTKEATFTYDPYGNQTGHTGTAATPLGYDAQYTSLDTGLIYMRARTYDPATAQFLTADPIEPLTRAPYSYAHDNPLNESDPAGLCSINPFSSSGCLSEGIEAGVHFAEQHYGQIAEAGALALCVATEVGALPCLAATGIGFSASTYQNITSPTGFSPSSEALDLLGALPGVQVTGAELAGFLGEESEGRTTAEAFSAIVGGSAIAGENPIAEADAATITCE
jgi:RHS repeat-associated protein